MFVGPGSPLTVTFEAPAGTWLLSNNAGGIKQLTERQFGWPMQALAKQKGKAKGKGKGGPESGLTAKVQAQASCLQSGMI